MTNPNRKIVLLGHIGVDAGIISVCDPCYLYGNDDKIEGFLGKKDETYNELLTAIGMEFNNPMTKDNPYMLSKIPYENGHEGKAIIFSTTYGDGYYTVYGVINEDNGNERIGKIIIDTEGCIDCDKHDDEKEDNEDERTIIYDKELNDIINCIRNGQYYILKNKIDETNRKEVINLISEMTQTLSFQSSMLLNYDKIDDKELSNSLEKLREQARNFTKLYTQGLINNDKDN